MTHANGGYYIPHGSHWPMVGSVGLITMLGGFAAALNGSESAWTVMAVGLAIILFMMLGWFGTVIRESEAGTYNMQVDRSFRWGMSWFIFSEVMFFAAFFGALFYARIFSIPWLGGEALSNAATHALLWPGFEATWPTNGPATSPMTTRTSNTSCNASPRCHTTIAS